MHKNESSSQFGDGILYCWHCIGVFELAITCSKSVSYV